jgi:hypothetical protein
MSFANGTLWKQNATLIISRKVRFENIAVLGTDDFGLALFRA